jgi:hypothetical protein
MMLIIIEGMEEQPALMYMKRGPKRYGYTGLWRACEEVGMLSIGAANPPALRYRDARPTSPRPVTSKLHHLKSSSRLYATAS